MKKSFATFLVVLFVLGLLAGCAGGATSEPPVSAQEPAPAQSSGAGEGAEAAAGGIDHSEYYEITYYQDGVDPRMADMMESNSFQKAIKEKFNMGVRQLPFPGDMIEFTTTMLAGGDFPEVVRLFETDIIKAYVEAGALLDLTPLIDQYGANFKARNEQYFDAWKETTGMNDGVLWAFNHWEPDRSITNSAYINEFFIRTDILEQQGYPDMKTEQDFLEVIKKGLEDNPETDGRPTIGIAYPMNAWGTTGMTVVQSVYNISNTYLYGEYNASSGSVYDAATDSFVDVTKTGQYLTGMKFWNQAWRDNVLDRESVTDSYEAYLEKLQQGRALGGYFIDAWNLPTLINPGLQQAGKDYRYISFPLTLSSNEGESQRINSVVSKPSAWTAMGITTNCKYPERVMELMDYIASEEGRILCGWGEEGVQYSIDENGLRRATPEHIEKLVSDPDYPLTFGGTQNFGFIPDYDDNGQCYLYNLDPWYVADTTDPIIKEVMGQYGFETIQDVYKNNPNFTLTEREQGYKNRTPSYADDLIFNSESMVTATNEGALAMIIAASDAEFDQAYQDLLTRRAESGIDELIATWNEEFAALNAG